MFNSVGSVFDGQKMDYFYWKKMFQHFEGLIADIAMGNEAAYRRGDLDGLIGPLQDLCLYYYHKMTDIEDAWTEADQAVWEHEQHRQVLQDYVECDEEDNSGGGRFALHSHDPDCLCGRCIGCKECLRVCGYCDEHIPF